MTASSTAGGAAGARAETSQTSSQDASLNNDTDIIIENGGLVWSLKDGVIDPNGEMRMEMPKISVKTGSESGQKSDDKQDAAAAASASAEAQAKAANQTLFWLMVAGAGYLILKYGWKLFAKVRP